MYNFPFQFMIDGYTQSVETVRKQRDILRESLENLQKTIAAEDEDAARTEGSIKRIRRRISRPDGITASVLLKNQQERVTALRLLRDRQREQGRELKMEYALKQRKLREKTMEMNALFKERNRFEALKETWVKQHVRSRERHDHKLECEHQVRSVKGTVLL